MNRDSCGSCPTYVDADGVTRTVPVFPWEDYDGPFGGPQRRARFYRQFNPAAYITERWWFVYEFETSAVVDRGPVSGGPLADYERVVDAALVKYWEKQ